jgi:hypothetical protein
MSLKAGQLATGLALTLITHSTLAAETPPIAAGAPPKTAAPSSGLLNDWLRQQSSGFESWDIGGQARVRYEVFEDASPAFPNLDFQKSGVSNDNSYLWTRERFHVGYKTSWVSFYTEAQNSDSVWDNDPKNPGADSFDLTQAYVKIGNIKEFPLSLKVGRQELSYGDERLLGLSDWGNTARNFDAAKIRYEQNGSWVDAFAGRAVVVDDTRFDEVNPHDWLFGVYGSTTKLVPIQETQLYFLSRNTGVGGTVTPRDIYSVGARVKSLPGKLKGWDYFGEAVGQFGNVTQAGQRREQQAYAVAFGGGYTWKDVVASPRLGLEYDFSSGDSDPNDGKSETLDNLFPINHKHYGLVDIVGWRNMNDVRFSVGLKPHKKLGINVDYHMLWLADTHDYFYPQSGAGRNDYGYARNSSYDAALGSEIDLDVTYAVTPWAVLRTGFGHFFTGSYIDSSKASSGGSTDADWAYVQATLSF